MKKGYGKHASDTHPMSVTFTSRTRDPDRWHWQLTSNHPEASSDYRRHLYQTTSLKINNILKDLLTRLHESTLQTVLLSGSPKNASTSPLKLSVPAKYEHLALQLHQPTSQFTLRLRRTDSQG